MAQGTQKRGVTAQVDSSGRNLETRLAQVLLKSENWMMRTVKYGSVGLVGYCEVLHWLHIIQPPLLMGFKRKPSPRNLERLQAICREEEPLAIEAKPVQYSPVAGWNSLITEKKNIVNTNKAI